MTYDYSKAMAAHLVLEQVIEIQCTLAKSTDDLGFAVTDESLLRVSNTPVTHFLLQAELRAINQGLQYIEGTAAEGSVRYYGYVNSDGQPEGVGVRIFTDGS